jgi:lysophospholipase L1-like esterase
MKITEPCSDLIEQVRAACPQPAAARALVEPPFGQTGTRIGAERDELIHDQETRLADQTLRNSATKQGPIGHPPKLVRHHVNDASLLCGFQQRLTLGRVESKWLLTQYVTPTGDRPESKRRVCCRCCRDGDELGCGARDSLVQVQEMRRHRTLGSLASNTFGIGTDQPDNVETGSPQGGHMDPTAKAGAHYEGWNAGAQDSLLVAPRGSIQYLWSHDSVHYHMTRSSGAWSWLTKFRAIASLVNKAQRPLRVVLIGDSTVCKYSRRQTTRGWGQFLADPFTEGTVKVINLAAAGRSTKTFMEEGRWDEALRQRPDYLLIQFGHNDSHAPGKPESTDAAGNFKDYLRRYVDESRAVGSIPVLITPMVRRTFDAAGKITEHSGVNALVAYVNAIKEIGEEKRLPVIDLYTSSKALGERLGPEASAAMADRPDDLTHFNERGARAMAELVVRELSTAVPELAKHLSSCG